MSSFAYKYPESFGQENTTGKGDNGTQTDIDKIVLKRLTQINKENGLTFKSLIKKMRMEMLSNIANNGIKRESLSSKMQRSPNYGVLLITTEDNAEITAKLESTAYSNLQSRRERTKHTLHLTRKHYTENCTLIPQCKDCTTNGAYSACTNRALVHTSKDLGTIPLSQYWAYVLSAK